LGWPKDPRRVIFAPVELPEADHAKEGSKSGESEVHQSRLLYHKSSSFSPERLGTVEFVRDPKSATRWMSSDDLLELTVSHAQLDIPGNRVTGYMRTGGRAPYLLAI
jgi:hypothetical protein